ncbi:hypothetical protein DFH11DRAFT_1881422 [Phellopilus nigrolimitatus]|nr:hypothetical protein DFH11DRAFT_1881422 [Phellopilus nigrolimitatus]
MFCWGLSSVCVLAGCRGAFQLGSSFSWANIKICKSTMRASPAVEVGIYISLHCVYVAIVADVHHTQHTPLCR